MTAASTRRGLLGMVAAGAVAMPAVAVGAPEQDVALLSLCAEFEAVQRRQNGLYQWTVWGGNGALQGPGFIEDDDEREAADAAFDGPLADLTDRMLDHTPTTLAGFQAVARCLLLSAGRLRDFVAEEIDDGHFGGLTASESVMVAALLRGLTGGAITDATCMDAPAEFVPDVVGAA